MKPGARYERFVFEKLQRLYPEAVVKLNDHIRGAMSGLLREIDVSIRITLQDTQLLYIVQCKDWSSRVDINTIGAFSAVMRDVGAAKGFLLCTSGFYQTNHQYALSVGIELVTIEDIESDKWNVQVEIPFVYVKKEYVYNMEIGITANEELVELNRERPLTLDLGGRTLIRSSPTTPVVSLEAYVVKRAGDLNSRATEDVPFDIKNRGLEVLLHNVWVPCTDLRATLHITNAHYLKYVTPTEYSQLRDHVRGTTLPLHLKVEGIQIKLDGSFTRMPEGSFAGFPGLWFQVEESSVIWRK